MKIKKVLCAIGHSGYIHRDLQAIKNGAKQNGFIYIGNPVLPGFKKIKELLNKKGFKVSLIADEWCNTFNDIKLFTDEKVSDYIQIKTPDLGGINNTIEAIFYCKKNGMKVCLGGTANETDQSSRITSHIALACNPDFLLSKPGLGGDEGIMILNNEMSRTLTIIS